MELRKCVSKNKSGKRWGVEFPLEWVERLELKNSKLELTEEGNIITIRKIGEYTATTPATTSEKSKEIKPKITSSSIDNNENDTDKIENNVKGIGRLVY